MIRVIVESPYGSEDPAVIQENIKYLRACMRDCVLRGETPYASHGLLTQEGVLRDEDPAERKLGIEAGFDWRPAAYKSVFYMDRGMSKGMKYGLEDAATLMSANPEHKIEFRFLYR